MKKIFSFAMLLLAGAFAFTSCSDDNDSNPTLVKPTSFTINSPAVGEALVDLSASSGIELTWSQPQYTNFNAPVIPTYTVQVSPSGTFNQAYDENLEDNTGADFFSLPETYSTGQATINAESLDKALVQLLGWSESSVPEELPLSIRVKAAVQDAGFNEYGEIYSNVVSLKTMPYYIELSNADPEIWYLIGADIADGSWGEAVGQAVIPMQPISGYEYDKKTGRGEITWTGYLGGKGFKLKKVPTSWDEQWGQGASFGTYVKNDGGSSDIKVPEPGIYTITLNTQADELKVELSESIPDVFSGMAISGSFNDWGDTEMTPCSTGWENHDWFIEATLDTDAEIKIKQAGSWDYNRGGTFVNYSEGMSAFGVANGDNLKIAEGGKYLILFNDITGFIRFIKK